MREYLKACPFCGSHTVEVCRTNVWACWIRCAKCGGEADTRKTRRGAFAAWNRRLDDGKPARIIEDDDKEAKKERRDA